MQPANRAAVKAASCVFIWGAFLHTPSLVPQRAGSQKEKVVKYKHYNQGQRIKTNQKKTSKAESMVWAD